MNRPENCRMKELCSDLYSEVKKRKLYVLSGRENIFFGIKYAKTAQEKDS